MRQTVRGQYAQNWAKLTLTET